MDKRYTPPELARQALALSYGTIATLINKNRYDEIEPIANEFLDFCLENSERYEIWQDAWREYAKIKGFPQHYQRGNHPKPTQDEPQDRLF